MGQREKDQRGNQNSIKAQRNFYISHKPNSPCKQAAVERGTIKLEIIDHLEKETIRKKAERTDPRAQIKEQKGNREHQKLYRTDE